MPGILASSSTSLRICESVVVSTNPPAQPYPHQPINCPPNHYQNTHDVSVALHYENVGDRLRKTRDVNDGDNLGKESEETKEATSNRGSDKDISISLNLCDEGGENAKNGLKGNVEYK